jgi:hypothetical protein
MAQTANDWLKLLEARLLPFEEMLDASRLFAGRATALRGFRPVRDARKFSLFRPLRTAGAHSQIKDWHRRMAKLKRK